MEVLITQCVWLFAIPWTVAHQAPLSMGFSRQEYWNGMPFPFPGAFPDPGIKLQSPCLQTDSLWSEPPANKNIYLSPNLVVITLIVKRSNVLIKRQRILDWKKYRQTSFYHMLLYCASQWVFLQEVCGNLLSSKSSVQFFQQHLVTVCLCHSLIILTISNFFIFFIMVICDQGSLILLLQKDYDSLRVHMMINIF